MYYILIIRFIIILNNLKIIKKLYIYKVKLRIIKFIILFLYINFLFIILLNYFY